MNSVPELLVFLKCDSCSEWDLSVNHLSNEFIDQLYLCQYEWLWCENDEISKDFEVSREDLRPVNEAVPHDQVNVIVVLKCIDQQEFTSSLFYRKLLFVYPF